MKFKIVCFSIWLVTLSVLVQSAVLAEEKMRLAVVEFEEKNNIGVENAGRIVAEWAVTELNKIDKFEVEERLMLKKVLEEQALMLTGVINDAQAVKIGQLYGLQALITGSVMKFGKEISITGRIINVENGKILKTASVTTDNLSKVEKEVVVLTNQLCDISREQFEIKKDIEQKSQNRLALGGGLGLLSNSNDDFGLALASTLIFTSPKYTLWIDGAPVGGLRNIEFGGVWQVNRFLGIGLANGRVFDDLIDYVSVNYLHFGIIARPRVNLEMGLFIGGALSGTIWTDRYEIKNLDSYWRFPANYSVSLIYYLNENLGLMVKQLGVEIGDFGDKIPVNYRWPGGIAEYSSGKLSLGILYRFVI